MKTLYTATAKADPKDDDQSDLYFVSIDGDHWLGANRLPTAEDYDDVVALFGTREYERKDGTKGHMRYITIATRALRLWTNACVFHDPIEVADAKAS